MLSGTVTDASTIGNVRFGDLAIFTTTPFTGTNLNGEGIWNKQWAVFYRSNGSL